jgi:putative tricarboxylic transport membrane protein
MSTVDRVAGVALALIGLFVVWESLLSVRKLPLGTIRTPGPAYVPVLLASLLIVFGIAIVVAGGGARKLRTLDWTEGRHAAGILVACGLAAVLLERLGFRITIAVVLFLLLAGLERKPLVFAAGFALALAFGTFYLFDTLLRVPLPRGPFGL